MTYEDLGTTKHNANFRQHCIVNNCESVLDLWDYDLNECSPEDITLLDGSYWFKCPKNLHNSEKQNIRHIIQRGGLLECSKCKLQYNSFGAYCERANRMDLIKRWDYDLNGCSPYDIPHSAHDKYYFKCPRGIHKSEPKFVYNILKQYNSSRCHQCDSFGQWGLDNIDENFLKDYWSDKNTEDPFQVPFRRSTKKIWIKCQKTNYHQDYQITPDSFVRNERCPYCKGNKVDKRDSVGTKFPKIFETWCEKKTTPYDYSPHSNKKKTFYCKKHDYYFVRQINQHVKNNCECPKCSKERTESRLQEKVRLYLEEKGYTVLHEWNCNLRPINPKTGRTMRYDNEVVEESWIIEVYGGQHYSSKSVYYAYNYTEEERKKMFKEEQWRDNYKKQYAIDHGYIYTAIPYWEDDKKDTWKKHIDDTINKIKSKVS